MCNCFQYAAVFGAILTLLSTGVFGADESPYDVAGAVTILERELSEKEKQTLISPPENFHMGFALRPLRNRWKLWGNSRLQRYFFRKGIYNPDWMSSVILEAFRASQRGETLDPARYIRDLLESISLPSNVPRIWNNAPREVRSLFLLYHIQLDDASIIHVFCTGDGKPKWVFHPDSGWSEADENTGRDIQTSRAIRVVQQYEPGDTQPHSLEDWFDSATVPAQPSNRAER